MNLEISDIHFSFPNLINTYRVALLRNGETLVENGKNWFGQSFFKKVTWKIKLSWHFPQWKIKKVLICHFLMLHYIWEWFYLNRAKLLITHCIRSKDSKIYKLVRRMLWIQFLLCFSQYSGFGWNIRGLLFSLGFTTSLVTQGWNTAGTGMSYHVPRYTSMTRDNL